jgi:hypothetical protein
MGVYRAVGGRQQAQTRKSSPLETWMAQWPWMRSQERASNRSMLRQLQSQIQSQGQGMVKDLSSFATDWQATPETVRQRADLLKSAYPAMRARLDALDPATVLPTERARALEAQRRMGAATKEQILGDPLLPQQIAGQVGLPAGDVSLPARSGIPEGIGYKQTEAQKAMGQPAIAPMSGIEQAYLPTPAETELQRLQQTRKAGMEAVRDFDVETVFKETEAKEQAFEPHRERTRIHDYQMAEWDRLFREAENRKDRQATLLLTRLREAGMNARDARGILARAFEGYQNRAQSERESQREWRQELAKVDMEASILVGETKENITTTEDTWITLPFGTKALIPKNSVGDMMLNKKGEPMRWIPDGEIPPQLRTSMEMDWMREGTDYAIKNPHPVHGTAPNPEVWIEFEDGAGAMGRFFDEGYTSKRTDAEGRPGRRTKPSGGIDWTGPKIFNISPPSWIQHFENEYNTDLTDISSYQQAGLGWVLGNGFLHGGVDIGTSSTPPPHPLGIPRGRLGADNFLQQYQQQPRNQIPHLRGF